MIETWKDIVGYEGVYMVSDFGNVKSLKWGKERLLKPGLVGTKGKQYLAVGLSKDRKQKSCGIHVEVAKAFLGHVPCGMDRIVDHIDENKLNNHLSNLQIITHRENVLKGFDSRKTSSKYRNVTWVKARNKWKAAIHFNGKHHNLGRFTDEVEAHECVERFRKENKIN